MGQEYPSMVLFFPIIILIRAAGDMDASMIRDLAAAIIQDGKVPSDWE